MRIKESLLYKIVRPIISLFFQILFTPNIKGRENIPATGRIILAGNHTSNFDCLLLMSATKRPIHFLAKDELWKGPKKIIFSNMGLIPVNRRQKDHNALVLAETYLKDEKLVGVFPEGTTEKGNMLPFKMGAFKMAKDTNTEIIPFAITGKYTLFSKNLTIQFGKKVSIKKELETEKQQFEQIIKQLIRGDE